LPTPIFVLIQSRRGPACRGQAVPQRQLSARGGDDREQVVVHNYGHGGCGITLSWGCAVKVRDIVKTHLNRTSGARVAVLGAGVMGLTRHAAARSRADVTLYYDRPSSATTSSKAGGQWAVSVVDFRARSAKLGEIIRARYTAFKDSIGKGFGVSERPNYTADAFA